MVLNQIAGLLLIAFSSVILLFAVPTFSEITTTGVGTMWENSSQVMVTMLGMSNMIFILLPALMFFMGLALLFDGG